MLHSTRHIRGARAIFAMRPSYSSLAHYMAPTTIYGAPMKRGVVPSGLTAHVSAYWVSGSWLRWWRMSCTNSWSNLRYIPAPQVGFAVLGLPGLVMFFFNMNYEVLFTLLFFFLLHWSGSRLFFFLAFRCVVSHIVSLSLHCFLSFRLLVPLYDGSFSHSPLFLFTFFSRVCIHVIYFPCLVCCISYLLFVLCCVSLCFLILCSLQVCNFLVMFSNHLASHKHARSYYKHIKHTPKPRCASCISFEDKTKMRAYSRGTCLGDLAADHGR
jgi:hypothetical protein